MSLTTQLKDPGSPFNAWINSNVNRAGVAAFAHQVNRSFVNLKPSVIKGADPSLVGTAYDYLFRWQYVGSLYDVTLVAYIGARSLGDRHKALMKRVVSLGNQYEVLRPECSIILAWYETLARPGRRNADLLESIKTPEQAFNKINLADIEDLNMLIEGMSRTWPQDKRSQNYKMNPTFDGSELVGGADADWIIDGCLYDCKTTRKQQPITAYEVLQLAGYVLLDFSDMYKLTHAGWYLPRYNVVYRFPLDNLFLNLEASRESLRKHLMRLPKMNSAGDRHRQAVAKSSRNTDWDNWVEDQYD
ncbi:MAG: hypothetical protein OHK0046_47360 [Anaerolineae bacterium]